MGGGGGGGCYSYDVRFGNLQNLQNRATAVSFCKSGNQNWNLISEVSISTKLEIQQNGTSPHGISRFAVLQKQEISKTGNALPHGISGVAVLLDQHIAKTV